MAVAAFGSVIRRQSQSVTGTSDEVNHQSGIDEYSVVQAEVRQSLDNPIVRVVEIPASAVEKAGNFTGDV